jgi:endonuclease/exonuclease/phosphatase family metal-dependent hydrolase
MLRRLACAVVASLGLVVSVVGVAGCGGSSGAATAASASTNSTYTLMQINLCLSGLADCYRKVRYPAVVEEAVARIRSAHPDAVTFNEACSGDAALIARRTGYHMRFSAVIYFGKLLPCVKPGGRGLFGDAVLVRAGVRSSENHAFAAQAGPEQRRWLCVLTRTGVDVCTSHLASPDIAEVAANQPQCAELGRVLARRAGLGAVIFGGDVNRRRSCAPAGFWARSDRSAHQDPGSQQVYGTGTFRSPSVRVVPAVHTDHDVLLVGAHLMTR